MEESEFGETWAVLSEDESERSDDEEVVIMTPSDNDSEIEIVENAAEPVTVMYKSGNVELSSHQICDNWKLSAQRQQKMDRRFKIAPTVHAF